MSQRSLALTADIVASEYAAFLIGKMYATKMVKMIITSSGGQWTTFPNMEVMESFVMNVQLEPL